MEIYKKSTNVIQNVGIFYKSPGERKKTTTHNY